MSKIKKTARYSHYTAYGTNGVGLSSELHITAWTMSAGPQFEIHTTRGISLFLTGPEAKKTAAEIIELLKPIAEHGGKNNA